LDNKDISEIMKNYEGRLKRLHFHAARLNEVKTIEEIAKHTVDAIATTLGLDARTRIGLDIPGGTFLYVKDNSLFVLGRTGHEAELTSVLASQGFPLDGKGITIRAVKTRETQFVPDARKDKDLLMPEWQTWTTLSELDVPVVIGDQAVAVLNCESSELKSFTDQDKLLLETLASHVASAIQRINLLEAKERYEERLKNLHRHASLLSATNNVPQVAYHTIDAMYKILGFGWCHFMIVEEGYLKVINMRGDTTQERHDLLKAGEYKLPLNGEGITVRTANLKKAMLVHDIREDPDYVDYGAPTVDGELIYASLSEPVVPVIANDEVLAVLNTESPNLNEFNEQDQELLETLASHVASAMARIRARDAVRDIAYRLNSLEPGGCYISESHERCLKAYAIL
jgi:GAF domain-containing protein